MKEGRRSFLGKFLSIPAALIIVKPIIKPIVVQGAAGDLQYFQNAAIPLAQNYKKLLGQLRELRSLWDKLALPGTDTAQAPLSNADLTNFATLCTTANDFVDNITVTAGDRRQIIERIASRAVSGPYNGQ